MKQNKNYMISIKEIELKKICIYTPNVTWLEVMEFSKDNGDCIARINTKTDMPVVAYVSPLFDYDEVVGTLEAWLDKKLGAKPRGGMTVDGVTDG